jgi:hypothetical protein
VERRCIDEMLRIIDGRKVRDEACVGSRRGERKGGWEKQASMVGRTMTSDYGERMCVLCNYFLERG